MLSCLRVPPVTLISAALASALVAGARLAAAQPGGAPPDAPPPASDGEPAAAAPTPAADPAELATTYDHAFAALLAGQLDTAIAGFDQIALVSVEPDRRAAARELSRLARALRARQVQLTAPAAPVEAPALRASLPEDDRPGAGRIEVVVSSTLASFYGGFVLSALFDVDDFQTGALLVTGATAAGFLTSFYATRGRDITGGMAESYTLGLALGSGNGFLLAHPFGADETKALLTMGLGAAALGGAAGLLLADHARPTRAQTTFVATASVLGIATTGLGLAITLPDDISSDAILLLLTGGLDVGAGVGLGLASGLDWSKSRARLVSLSVFLGGLAGVGGSAILVGEPEDRAEIRAYAAATLAGMWGGFGLGVRLTRDMQPDERFAAGSAAPAAQVVPAAIEGGAGVAIAGTF